MANWIFIFDILSRFAASYKDKSIGAEIFHPGAIALHYLSTEFTFDFISTLQLRSIGENWLGITNPIFIDLADMCQLLKVLRIKKILYKIESSNLRNETKA